MAMHDANRLRHIRGEAERIAEAHRLPGFGLALATSRDVPLAVGIGFADVESRRPQDPAARQRIGSITKTMVGLVVMSLVEEGKLGLDDRVALRLPDVRLDGPADALRVRHLLSHTGGIGEAPTLAGLRDPEAALWSDSPGAPAVRDAYPDGIQIEVPPGTKWAYANHGWVLLGEIAARAAGLPIENLLARRIFEPLRMRESDCRDEPHPALSTPYHHAPDADARELLERAGRAVPDEPTVDGHNIRGSYRYLGAARAAGAVQATLDDMTRYARALLRRADGIVRPDTFAAMLAPAWSPHPRFGHVGLAFFCDASRFGHASFGHNGGVAGGWNTHLSVFPDLDLAVLLHANCSHPRFDTVVSEVLRAVLGPEAALPPAPLDPRVAASAPGLWEAPQGPLTNVRVATSTGRLRVDLDGGELRMTARRGAWKQGVRLIPADPGEPGLFAVEDGAPERALVWFSRDARGDVTGLHVPRFASLVRAS
jgi:CubicO group peptidase (beta-lactamase class C family)